MERKNKLINPLLLYIVTAVAVVGTCVGVALSENSEEAQSMIKETVLFSGDFRSVFEKAMAIKVLWIILFAFGGINVFLIPVSLAAVFAKCYSYGFTSGCVVYTLGERGYFLVAAGLFLHNFIFTVFAVFYTTFAVNKAFECYLNRRNYDYKLKKNKIFIGMTALTIVFSVAIALLESGISVYFHEV